MLARRTISIRRPSSSRPHPHRHRHVDDDLVVVHHAHAPGAAPLAGRLGLPVEGQDDDLAGGLVIRTFERYQPVPGGDRAAEARVWWLDGVPVLAGPHPDTPDVTPAPDLDDIAPLVAALGCRLVATDISRRVDGAWRVVEVGDGQVSDRPSTVPPSRLVMPLLHAPSRSGPATAR